MSYIFASFFGAFMVASFYAYYHFKFQEYKFIDFNSVKLYGNTPIFKPTDEQYVIFIYNSNSKAHKQILSNMTDIEYKIIAIDLHQKIYSDTKDVIYLTSATNKLLNIIQTFNIYEAPVSFLIQRVRNFTYKQNSKIKILTKGNR
jgi:hypothetical protein